MTKNISSLLIAVILATIVVTTVYAGIYIGPGGTVGGVNVSWSHYITTGTKSFLTQANSTSFSNISRIGGNTFASRVWCGSTIRDTANHGGWVQYNKSAASLSGGLTWGARCTNQKAGTAAQHDFSNGGQTLQPYFYATELRP